MAFFSLRAWQPARRLVWRGLPLGLTAALALPVAAHVVLEYQVAPAARSYKATFQVSHGCGDSPTRQLVVDIPVSMRGARPMPKPGWDVEVLRTPAADSAKVGGSPPGQRVRWTARTVQDQLSSAHYDEFALVATTPTQPGTLYWPVRQICASGQRDWIETPLPGQDVRSLKAPAAVLEILPGAAAAAHNH